MPRYNKRRKRLALDVLRILNDVQARVLQDPYRGDPKRGAFKNIWVEKFQAQNDQYLLAYTIDSKQRAVVFYDVGQHENFYRDLADYIKARKYRGEER